MTSRNNKRPRIVRRIQTESPQLNPGSTIRDECNPKNQSNVRWIVNPRDGKAHELKRGRVSIVNALRKMRMREIEHSQIYLRRALCTRCHRESPIS